MDDIISPSRELLAPAFQRTIIPQGANPGLVFDRYLSIWSKGKRVDKLFEPLKRFATRFNELKNDRPEYLATLHARQTLVIGHANRNGTAGLSLPCKVAWRLVSGLGNDHPLENGFTMDHLTGAPYLRGSALKGLCRRVAELHGDEDGWDPETRRLIFGSEDPMADSSKGDKARGDIVFLDAYPAQWPELEVEVMNAHHQGYYQKDELRETEDPKPVFFLTVGAGTKFVFRLFSRTGSQRNVGRMKQALLEGLSLLGVGAKTAVGYGRFIPPTPEGEQWLERTLKELGIANNEPNQTNIVRGRALAGRWQELSDSELKKSALEAIKQRWQELKLFESGGRALRQVKQIYGWE